MSRNSLLPWSNRSDGNRRGSGPRRAFVRKMETLEDRRLLTVTVGNETDVVNGDVTSIAALVANDGGDGISLREAITAANSTTGADVIDFAPQVNGTISLTGGQLDVTDDLSIYGPGKSQLTISGNGQSRVFDVTDASLAMNQLTVANGHAVFDPSTPWIFAGGIDGGGGIRASESDVILEHVVLENNRFEGGGFLTPSGGGAIQAQGGSVTLDHVTARNNQATDLDWFAMGGALFTNGSSVQISHSEFADNRVAPGGTREVAGGAVGTRGGHTVISDSRFSGNQADGDVRGRGGAIMAQTGNVLEVYNSHFNNNSTVGTTAQGGAIGAFQGVTSTISDSQFVRNSAVGDLAQGGAIWNSRGFGGTMTIENSSIVNNLVSGDAQAEGGGIYHGTDVGPPMLLTVTNTNVNANQAMGTGNGASGIGGGIFNTQTINIDKLSSIRGNKASTSNDDVFGDLDLLDEVLALD